MKTCRLLLLSILCLCCTQQLIAQQQQLIFRDKSSKISICAQYREANGDMVSVANLNYSPFYPFAMVFKTDRAGNVLWSFTDTLHGAGERMRIGKLANKDYLVLNASGRQIMRIKPDDGAMIWNKSVLFSSSLSHEIRGFAELPDGKIVVCGYNDEDFPITSDRQYEGFLAFFDSAGTYLNCKYYGHTNTFIDYNYCFYDVAYLNNKLYVAGGFGKYFYTVIDDAVLMSMDLSGNLLKTSLLQTPAILGTDTISPRFTDLSVTDGKLYVQGASGPLQLVARVDTTTFSLSGHIIRVKPYLGYGSSRFHIKDSNTFYSQISAGTSFLTQKTFISKVTNGVLSYCKKVHNDSLMVINSMVCVADDTVFVAGRVNNFFKGYAAYFQLSDTAKSCGVSDTLVSVTAFTKTLTTPLYAPATHLVFVTSYPYYRWVPHCVYSLYVCGDKLCPNTLKADMDTPAKTDLCIGDTVLLKDEGCSPKTWYRNGIAITDTSNYLKVTEEGTYMLIVSNNACADTAKVVFYKKFIPIITQSGDSLFSTSGLSYQWLDNTHAVIGGATSRYYIPAVSGTYYVRVTDSSGCEQISDSFVFEIPVSLSRKANLSSRMLEVFPNPANEQINIHNKTGKTATLIIRDVNGRTIMTKNQLPGVQEYQLSHLGIKSGMYWVQLLSDEFCASEKIIVMEE